MRGRSVERGRLIGRLRRGLGIHASPWRATALAALAALLLAVSACSRDPDSIVRASQSRSPAPLGLDREVVEIDPPAALGAMAPNLATVGADLAATWLEPVEAAGTERHRLRLSFLRDGNWSRPVTIFEGSNFFANWADLPSLVEAGDGTLYAHWLAKTAAETYAYSIFLARSIDRGASWEPMGKLNADTTPTEHGFVSFVPEGRGARAFWLDGRRMIDGDPMTLLTAPIGNDGRIGPEELLDERVCECCSTAAAVSEAGPVIVYRDRSELEIRDVGVVRWTGPGWSDPARLAEDSWKIAGCPVNGPEIAAAGPRVVVAWFSSAQDSPRLQVAFSEDSAASFGEPVVVAAGEILGRVDVALDADGLAWVSWVELVDEGAEIRLRPVATDGSLGAPRTVARTSPSRASGFPRLERLGGRLYVAFVEVGDEIDGSRLRVRAL